MFENILIYFLFGTIMSIITYIQTCKTYKRLLKDIFKNQNKRLILSVLKPTKSEKFFRRSLFPKIIWDEIVVKSLKQNIN